MRCVIAGLVPAIQLSNETKAAAGLSQPHTFTPVDKGLPGTSPRMTLLGKAGSKSNFEPEKQTYRRVSRVTLPNFAVPVVAFKTAGTPLACSSITPLQQGALRTSFWSRGKLYTACEKLPALEVSKPHRRGYQPPP